PALALTRRGSALNVVPRNCTGAVSGRVAEVTVARGDDGSRDSGGHQPALFGLNEAAPGEGYGYRGPTACSAAGISYRQLDYWARTGLVEPSVRPAHGAGTQRLYSFRDVVVLKIVKRLLDTGVALQNIRTAVRHLSTWSSADVARTTLMCDGATVYECTSP